MADTTTQRDRARKRAQNHFTASEQRDCAVKQMIAAENAARDAKTAKLRALRLAKEETDREAARLAALNAPPAPAKKKTAPHRRQIAGHARQTAQSRATNSSVFKSNRSVAVTAVRAMPRWHRKSRQQQSCRIDIWMCCMQRAATDRLPILRNPAVSRRSL